MIQPALFDDLRLSGEAAPLLPSPERQFTAANSLPLRVLGLTVLIFKLGEQPVKHEFYVVEDLSHGIILGIDFLTKAAMELNLPAQTVFFRTYNYNL